MAKMTPVDATFFDTAPLRFETAGVVHATPAEVWEEIIGDNWTEWFPGMSLCSYSTPLPRGLDSVRTVKINGLEVEERVVVFDPERAWAFSGLRANVPFAKRLLEGFALEATDGGASTRLTYRAGIETTWATRLVSKLLRRQMTASWAEAIDALDQHLQ